MVSMLLALDDSISADLAAELSKKAQGATPLHVLLTMLCAHAFHGEQSCVWLSGMSCSAA